MAHNGISLWPTEGSPCDPQRELSLAHTKISPWLTERSLGPLLFAIAIHDAVMNCRGIQEGYPLGPLLFAIAIHDAIMNCKQEVDEKFPKGLDFMTFYLDDGTVAGDAEAVQFFSTLFQQKMAAIGLTLSPGKCEVAPAAGALSSVPPELFPGWQWKRDGWFN